MDKWFKGLVAAACVVTIAGVGYFVWRDRQETARRDRLAQQSMCDVMLSQMKSGNLSQEWRVLHVTNCVVDGYLAEAEFATPQLASYLDQARDSIEYARKK